jgi:hypothetical protein
VRLPVFIIDETLHIILQIIGKRTYDEKIHHDPKDMAGYLYINIIPEQPVTIKENGNDQDA